MIMHKYIYHRTLGEHAVLLRLNTQRFTRTLWVFVKQYYAYPKTVNTGKTANDKNAPWYMVIHTDAILSYRK